MIKFFVIKIIILIILTKMNLEKLAGIDDSDLIYCIKNRTITSVNISSFNLTELLRGAFYSKYLKNRVAKYLKYKPLPLKTYFDNTDNKIIIYLHQIKSLDFMRMRESVPSHYGIKGGMMCLDVGLGKSFISMVHSLITPKLVNNRRPKGYPTLIICSKTLLPNWKFEFEKFFLDDVKVLYLHNDYLCDYDISEINQDIVCEYDFVITTYDVCMKGYRECHIGNDVELKIKNKVNSTKTKDVLQRSRKMSNNPLIKGEGVVYYTPWERVVCDESQIFSNPDTKKFRSMMGIYARFKWCLTGTPIRNYDTDIWTQLRFCGYNQITTKKEWRAFGQYKLIEHSLYDCVQRMSYEDAGIVLPDKIFHKISIDLSNKERLCYDFIEGNTKSIYEKMLTGVFTFSSILALFTRLRQCSIAPYLMIKEKYELQNGIINNPDNERGKNFGGVTHNIMSDLRNKNPKLFSWLKNKNGTSGLESSKISKIIEIIKYEIPIDEKIIIFSMFNTVLDLLRDRLDDDGIQYVQVDGTVKNKERYSRIQRFRKDPDIQILLMNYKVGSEGLTLIEANHVIPVEPWWNSSVIDQAVGRCHRFGQQKDVNVYQIISDNTIEDRILEVCEEKDKLRNKFLSKTRSEPNISLDKYSLGRLLNYYK